MLNFIIWEQIISLRKPLFVAIQLGPIFLCLNAHRYALYTAADKGGVKGPLPQQLRTEG